MPSPRYIHFMNTITYTNIKRKSTDYSNVLRQGNRKQTALNQQVQPLCREDTLSILHELILWCNKRRKKMPCVDFLSKDNTFCKVGIANSWFLLVNFVSIKIRNVLNQKLKDLKSISLPTHRNFALWKPCPKCNSWYLWPSQLTTS